MNLTLEQAMARATKGPLKVGEGFRIEQDLKSWDGQPTLGRIVADVTHDDRGQNKINAALIAHWYNRGPELVEKFDAFVDQVEKLAEKHKFYIRYPEEILTRAKTVTIPD